jgi:DNA-binding MarR family transcriptional regulator
VINAVLTASRVLVGIAAASLADIETTVSPIQFRTLVVLDSRGELELGSLAETLVVSTATATRVVDRLAAAGLVTRVDQPGKRRTVFVGLSQAGAEVVWRVTDRRRAQIARVVRELPVEKREDLVAALNAFADAAGEPPAAGPGGFGW